MKHPNRFGRVILLTTLVAFLPLQPMTSLAADEPQFVREIQIIGTDLRDDELEKLLEQALVGRVLAVYMPPPPPELPDLVINEINARPVNGTTAVEIEVIVENRGVEYSPAYETEIFVQLYQNGTIVAALSYTRERFEILQAGATRRDRFNTLIPLNTLPLGADVVVTANVDPGSVPGSLAPGGKIKESHEDNNYKQTVCRILGSEPGTNNLPNC